MSRVVKLTWSGSAGAPSRKDRRSGPYEAYIPDRLVGRTFTLDGDVAADVADAELAIARFGREALALTNTEALARLLLRAESVASSRIEGLEIGPRRLLRVEAARELGETISDVTANEVLGNIDAMIFALHGIREGGPITPDTLYEFHRRLFVDTRLAVHAGTLRQTQNWIGGSDYAPFSAAFVPPPPQFVPELIADLCAFCNEDDLPVVAQVAIAHAQFETIHPFVDGNGRTGRALIHLIMRRRGLTPKVLPPVSLVLATWAKDYIDGLSATRYRGTAHSREAHAGINLWIGRFAGACHRAVQDVAVFENRIRDLQASWRARLDPIRVRSATDALISIVVGAPVITVKTASALIGRSFPQTNEAIARLIDASVLTQISVGRRNRAFEAPEVIDAFIDLERQLASPVGNTRITPPVRRTPAAKHKR